MFNGLNRNKKSIAIDLNSLQGMDILKELIKTEITEEVILEIIKKKILKRVIGMRYLII